MRITPHSIEPLTVSNVQRPTFNAQRSRAPDFGVRRSLPALELPNSRTLELPRAAFTILELLIVMGVLALLLAILLPTVRTVRDAALLRRADADATALAQAAIRYKTEYGFWPGQLEPNNSGAPETTDLHIRQDFQLKAWTAAIVSRCGKPDFNLTAVSLPQDYGLVPLETNEVAQAFATVGRIQGSVYPLNPLNPRRIHFYDLANETDYDTVSTPDPWGHQYILIMGLNPHSTFTHQIKNSAGAVISTHTVSNQIAFAFSFGPPADQGTNYRYSVGAGL